MTAAASPQDRWFYPTMALVLITLALAGFGPTFFMRGWVDSSAPLPPATFVHGVCGTAWLLLFALQTLLIAARRDAWHRAVGLAGAVVTVAFVVSGGVVTANLESSHGAESLAWRAAHLFTNGAPLTAFAVLVGAGLWQRGVAARHKRLMLLAAVVLAPPAIGRLLGPLGLSDFNLTAYAALAFANAIYDWGARGRPHAVALLGAVLLVAIDVTTTLWLAAVGS